YKLLLFGHLIRSDGTKNTLAFKTEILQIHGNHERSLSAGPSIPASTESTIPQSGDKQPDTNISHLRCVPGTFL
ncbi:MAG TPA: hypothetical protein VKO67_00710, partial [Smithellaceae bacterium]|nr:hypothetical protein [Smithellaceae bacterium]